MTTNVINSADMAKKYALPSIPESQISSIHIENVALTNEGIKIDYAIGQGDCSDFVVDASAYNEWLESENLLHCEWLGKNFDLCDYWNNTDYEVRLMDARLYTVMYCVAYNNILDGVKESISNILKTA